MEAREGVFNRRPTQIDTDKDMYGPKLNNNRVYVRRREPARNREPARSGERAGLRFNL